MLACCLLLTGCSAYQSLRPEEEQKFRGSCNSCNAELMVTTTDGSSIQLKPFRYVVVREPSDFVYAVGVTWDREGSKIPFHGKVPSENIVRKDTTLWLDEYTQVTGPVYWFQTEAGSVVRAPERDVIFVNKSGGTGIWHTGLPDPRAYEGKYKQGIIRFGDIASVQSYRFSSLATVRFVVAAVCSAVAVFALIYIAELRSSSK